jgi:hypothetical protein
VALAAFRCVDGELHQLAVGDGVAIGIRGGCGDREPDDAVALQRDKSAMAGVGRPGQRVAPQLGEVDLPQLARGRDQRGVRRGPGACLDRGDRLGVFGPGDPDRDVCGRRAHHPIVAAPVVLHRIGTIA